MQKNILNKTKFSSKHPQPNKDPGYVDEKLMELLWAILRFWMNLFLPFTRMETFSGPAGQCSEGPFLA